MKKILLILVCAFTIFSQAQKLKNITWVLSKIEDKEAKTSINLKHTHSILRFEDSTYTGYGCNGFSGKYKITGDKINFLGGMQITDNGCGNPDDYKAENYVLENFIQLQYKQVGDNLILGYNGNVIFTYYQQTQDK